MLTVADAGQGEMRSTGRGLARRGSHGRRQCGRMLRVGLHCTLGPRHTRCYRAGLGPAVHKGALGPSPGGAWTALTPPPPAWLPRASQPPRSPGARGGSAPRSPAGRGSRRAGRAGKQPSGRWQRAATAAEHREHGVVACWCAARCGGRACPPAARMRTSATVGCACTLNLRSRSVRPMFMALENSWMLSALCRPIMCTPTIWER